MGQQYSEISEKLKEFTNDQKIFFVGTATANSRINISPKGMDSETVGMGILKRTVSNNYLLHPTVAFTPSRNNFGVLGAKFGSAQTKTLRICVGRNR